jgi:hypothetical protein
MEAIQLNPISQFGVHVPIMQVLRNTQTTQTNSLSVQLLFRELNKYFL